YTPSLVATAWLGFDQPKSLGSRETGVGAALRAEVSINRRHWRYLAGQRRPSGQAPEARYQLEAIAVPCVHLRSGAVRRTACLAAAASLDNGAASAAGATP
ncbi:hypothetical protein WLX73_25215, partial [Bordetella bronchiseptica]